MIEGDHRVLGEVSAAEAKLQELVRYNGAHDICDQPRRHDFLRNNWYLNRDHSNNKCLRLHRRFKLPKSSRLQTHASEISIFLDEIPGRIKFDNLDCDNQLAIHFATMHFKIK
jgi:hypothetical protein